MTVNKKAVVVARNANHQESTTKVQFIAYCVENIETTIM